jgi:hypothetical protein
LPLAVADERHLARCLEVQQYPWVAGTPR